MKWRTKARLLKAMAALPKPISDASYQYAQRFFGQRRPWKTCVERCLSLIDAAAAHRSLQGASVMEVGTGPGMNMPILLWLLGAERITIVDLRRNLSPRMLQSHMDSYRSHRQWLVENLVFRAGGGVESVERLERMLALNVRSPKKLLEQMLMLCNVTYLAPLDGGCIDLPDGSFDLHLSNSALEHVPVDGLRRVLRTGARLLKPGGLSAHRIDHSDHFAYSDQKIGKCNFLRFDDEEWNGYAGNRFVYVNRLRSSQYPPIFEASGLEIRSIAASVDSESRDLIASGALPLAKEFRGMSASDLATTTTIIVAAPS